ncbi:hypothetical protein A3H26_00075 [candidate division WWE3 bacterium RIFCSPLOWO2_12_FULL_36_10]|uniref:Uncharacterized protein n=1 Tax=candidate division WWE3 bacterium RIFCSPLOWO2_12_FULL_36_10 TaxID=1802630 RepID=A0A1F4VL43_UNCKA|nr:MAG: hypothetical protein A3H26_00075 [candidate division WWE3 bacterium RIFCSPLOWO2_12_FULL_36_10]
MSVVTQASTAPQVGESYVLKENGCLSGITEGGSRKCIYRTASVTDVGLCVEIRSGKVYLKFKNEGFIVWVGIDVFKREMALLQ